MPTPYDLLSQKLDDPTDPDDQLRLMLGQDQGANLQGGPDDTPDAQTPPSQGGAPGVQPMAPSPNVPGPLAALARKTPTLKPHIKLKSKLPMKRGKPRIKPKPTPGPSSALQNFLASIGTSNNG